MTFADSCPSDKWKFGTCFRCTALFVQSIPLIDQLSHCVINSFTLQPEIRYFRNASIFFMPSYDTSADCGGRTRRSPESPVRRKSDFFCLISDTSDIDMIQTARL